VCVCVCVCVCEGVGVCVSFKDLVLFIKVMLCERLRS